jgi:hypothetical protein
MGIYNVGNYKSLPHFLMGALFMYLIDVAVVSKALEQYSKSDAIIMFLIVGGLMFMLLAVIGTITYYRLKADNLEQASQKKEKS